MAEERSASQGKKNGEGFPLLPAKVCIHILPLQTTRGKKKGTTRAGGAGTSGQVRRIFAKLPAVSAYLVAAARWKWEEQIENGRGIEETGWNEC